MIGDPHNRIKHYLATHILLYYKYNTGFGDPKASAQDPKVGREPPVEKHWSKLTFGVFFKIVKLILLTNRVFDDTLLKSWQKQDFRKKYI